MQPTSPLRELLAATALRVGPDAPTLCSPWTVQDLLAHLVLRESRPDALPGIGLPVPALGEHTERLQDRAAGEHSLEELADRVRSGPPAWWPTRVSALDRLVNTAELSIHLEDIVRAQPGWSPSELGEDVQAQLWRTLTSAGRLLYRSSPVGVVAVAEGHGRAALRGPRSGSGSVVLRGTPLELVLHAFGRERVARVEVEGAPEDVVALAAHTRSV